MENFLKAASIAWNPIGEVQRRISSGELTVLNVLAPFIGIVIVCNLFVGEAQNFFYEIVLNQVPDYPLITNDFAKRMMSALTVLVPVGAVSLLPSRAFYPVGRSATLAAMIIVSAGWAFYGAAMGTLVYFAAGVLAIVDVNLGLSAFFLFSIPMIIIIGGLTLFFWLRITISVLGLKIIQVISISLVAIIVEILAIGFITSLVETSLLSRSPPSQTQSPPSQTQSPPSQTPDISGTWKYTNRRGDIFFFVFLQNDQHIILHIYDSQNNNIGGGEGTIQNRVVDLIITGLNNSDKGQLKLKISQDEYQLKGSLYFARGNSLNAESITLLKE